MATKEQKDIYFVIAFLIVSVLDGFSNLLGTVPILGDIASAVSNVVWEFTQILIGYFFIQNQRRR